MSIYTKEKIIEKIIQQKETIKLIQLDNQIIKIANKNNIKLQANALEYSLFNLCNMDSSFINWFKQNIINTHNKTYIYLKYIYLLNYLSCPNKENSEFNRIYDLDSLKKSFLITGLIKDIEEKNGTYKLTFPNNASFKFCRLTDSQEATSQANGYCHQVSEDLSITKELEGGSFCTGKYKDYFEQEHYHTFLVKSNLALDASHNIVANFEDYINLLNFEIILFQDIKKSEEEINYLDASDKKFKKSDMVPILKLAISKQHFQI